MGDLSEFEILLSLLYCRYKKHLKFLGVGLLIGTLLLFLMYAGLVWPIETSSSYRNYGQDSLPTPSVVLGGKPPGIGNQLFWYAAAYALAKNLSCHVNILWEIDASRTFSHGERAYALDMFNLDPRIATQVERDPQIKYGALTARKPFTFVTEVDFFEDSIPNNQFLVMDDVWEAELFFSSYKQDILKQYQLVTSSFPLPIKFASQIENSESVAVHFRIQDFGEIGRTLPFSYQIRAIKLMQYILAREQRQRNLTFFIFSDDIETVKSKFIELSPTLLESVVFVSNSRLTSIQELYLMTKCKHAIIPNSTFSWWGAYLIRNEKKVVIAPFPRERASFYEQFSNLKNKKYKMIEAWNYIYPKEWVTMNPFESFEDSL